MQFAYIFNPHFLKFACTSSSVRWRTSDGKILSGNEEIVFGLKSKTVLRGGKSVLLVVQESYNGQKLYRCCNKKQLRSLGDDINVL